MADSKAESRFYKMSTEHGAIPKSVRCSKKIKKAYVKGTQETMKSISNG